MAILAPDTFLSNLYFLIKQFYSLRCNFLLNKSVYIYRAFIFKLFSWCHYTVAHSFWRNQYQLLLSVETSTIWICLLAGWAWLLGPKWFQIGWRLTDLVRRYSEGLRSCRPHECPLQSAVLCYLLTLMFAFSTIGSNCNVWEEKENALTKCSSLFSI